MDFNVKIHTCPITVTNVTFYDTSYYLLFELHLTRRMFTSTEERRTN